CHRNCDHYGKTVILHSHDRDAPTQNLHAAEIHDRISERDPTSTTSVDVVTNHAQAKDLAKIQPIDTKTATPIRAGKRSPGPTITTPELAKIQSPDTTTTPPAKHRLHLLGRIPSIPAKLALTKQGFRPSTGNSARLADTEQ